MPSDPKVWVVLIVAAAIVVGLLIWFRGRLRFRGHGIALDVEPPCGENKIVVGKKVRMNNVEAGDIAGVKTEGSATSSGSTSCVDVLGESKLRDSTVGDIVGIKQTQHTPTRAKK